jgi:D-glycero-D-manno-heptose 1,7-bisphosphate phosphatase
MTKAAFLDRDGVINEKATENGYIKIWDEMRIFPDVVPAIALLNQAGFRVIVVTNQRCIAKGLLTAAQLEAIHRNMCDEISTAGAKIDAVYYCPHEKHPACDCRKPRPGMLFEAAREYDIDLGASWIIGDSQADLDAGRAAGCKTALLTNNNEKKPVQADVVGRSLLEAVQAIFQTTDSVASLDRHL